MSNKIKQEINKIEIPNELSQRSKLGISEAKKEMKINNKRFKVKGIAVAVAILISIGTLLFLNNNLNTNNMVNNQKKVVTKDGGIKIPAIQLPKGNTAADMIGLIVYNRKVYTQTRTEIDAENAKAILGKKLGTTKGNIDEWSNQKDYDKEFASTTGIADVYSVKGYDKDFRIMTYGELDGKPYAQFYENLNGITIHNGKDVFGKLKMLSNVTKAQYRTANDWDNNIQNYHSIIDMKIVNAFVEELNGTKQFLRGENSDPIANPKSNDNFSEITITLKDGSKVRLLLLKGGYIYYGFMGAYFKMDDKVFTELWKQIQ